MASSAVPPDTDPPDTDPPDTAPPDAASSVTDPFDSRDPGRSLCIIGAGPAGLMAAEHAALAGVSVSVYDAMPTAGRKFLMAGKSGLNLTHSEPLADFVRRYGEATGFLAPMIHAFGPQQIRDWAAGLGVETFTGSSGRVFPQSMKAAPLLRAWLKRLRALGVRFHMRSRWLGWDDQGGLLFSREGEVQPALHPAATILALGGASWPRLGSDGQWVPWLQQRGVEVSPFRPANCGFDCDWTPLFRQKWAGQPVKAVRAWPGVMPAAGSAKNGDAGRDAALPRAGEFVISENGIEGSLVYALSAPLRDSLERGEAAALYLDLLPGWTDERLHQALQRPRASESLSTWLKKTLRLEGLKVALLRECLPASLFRQLSVQSPASILAPLLKALPLPVQRPRPLAEAISSAGGVTCLSPAGVDQTLMAHALPGVFCCGEMLDWEAPTGGYLLTACLATGAGAGRQAARWIMSGEA